jgi:hypothetical protein
MKDLNDFQSLHDDIVFRQPHVTRAGCEDLIDSKYDFQENKYTKNIWEPTYSYILRIYMTYGLICH